MTMKQAYIQNYASTVPMKDKLPTYLGRPTDFFREERPKLILLIL